MRRTRCTFHHSAGALAALALTLAGFAAGAADPQADADGAVKASGSGGEEAELVQDDAAEPTEEPSAPESSATPSQGVEEIVITGSRDVIEMTDTTASTVVFGEDELQALGVEDVSDLEKFVPNLEIVTVSATTPTFFIRGVGLNDFNANAPGAVAVYHDGVPINAPAIQLGTLFDVQGVEILRGPQGDNGFRNASAGVISITSRRPSGELGASLRADFGNYEFMDFEGALEAPILPSVLSSRLAFRLTQRAPYVHNGCGRKIDTPRKPPIPPPGIPGAQVCGEVSSVTEADVFIDPDLPTKVNDKFNWALRGTLLLEPPAADLEWPAEMQWTLSGHYERVRQDATLGQVLGTEISSSGPATVQGYVDPALNEIYQQQAVLFGVQEPGVPQAERLRRRAEANAATLDEATRNIGRADPYRNDYNLVGPEHLDSYGGFLEGTANFGPFELRTITGGEAYERLRDTDFDMSSNPSIQLDLRDDASQITQSIDLIGHELDRIPLRWTVGGFYLGESLHSNSIFNLQRTSALSVPIFQNYTQKLQSGGIYGNIAWDLFDGRFTLDAGVRYNVEYKTFDLGVENLGRMGGGDDDKLWSAPTGRIGLTWHVSDGLDLFAKYTRGWKPGHFNASVLQLGQVGQNTFEADITVADPETIDSFELGMGGSWLDGRLALRGSLFYYGYSDYQVFLLTNEAGSAPQFEVLNANDAEIYGAELDLDLQPLEGLLITGRLGWLESQFLDFTDLRSQRGTLPGGATFTKSVVVDFTGNQLPNSPRFKASGAAEYTIDLGRFGSVTPRYDFAYTDRVYFDPSEGKGVPALTTRQIPLTKNALSQRAYILQNARLSWSSENDRYGVALWVRNITDETYKTFVADATVNFSSLLNFIGEPRTYGISVELNY